MIDSLTEQIEKLIWSDYLQRFGRPGAFAATILRYVYGMLRDMLSSHLTLHARFRHDVAVDRSHRISFAMAKGLRLDDQENLDTFLIHLGPMPKTSQLLWLIR
jgi:hypothetical protein